MAAPEDQTASAKQLESTAETEPDAVSNATNHAASTTNTANEKEMSNAGASSEEGSMAAGPTPEDAKKEDSPQQADKSRGKAKIAAIMGALMVWLGIHNATWRKS